MTGESSIGFVDENSVGFLVKIKSGLFLYMMAGASIPPVDDEKSTGAK